MNEQINQSDSYLTRFVFPEILGLASQQEHSVQVLVDLKGLLVSGVPRKYL